MWFSNNAREGVVRGSLRRPAASALCTPAGPTARHPLSLSFRENSPLVDHAAIGQPTDPVHAAGSFTHLALAAALDAKHRGGIGKRPSWRRGKGQPQRK